MSENLSSKTEEQRIEKLTSERKKLEKLVVNFPVGVKQLKLFLKLKVEYGLSSLKTIKTREDYYSQSYERRCQILQAPNLNTYTLWKTIVMKNKKYREELADDPTYPQFIGVIVQYMTKLHSAKLSDLMKDYQNSRTQSDIKASKKNFHFRVADEQESLDITRCEFNGVTPFEWDQKTYGNIPIVISENLLNLDPQYFYLGAGEYTTKFGISIEDFRRYHGDNLIFGDIIEPLI